MRFLVRNVFAVPVDGLSTGTFTSPCIFTYNKKQSACIFSKLEFSNSTLKDVASSSPNVPRVVLKKGRSQFFRGGNPMVYSGAVDRIIGKPPPQVGDVVFVTDGALHPIAWGVYNPVSMFCVRIMEMEDDASRNPSYVLNMEKLLKLRISTAKELRESLGLPADNTDVYRLVNSEGDRLSGLVVDIFGSYAVIASSAAWVERYRSEVELVVGSITKPRRIFWKSSAEILKEEGVAVEKQKNPLASTESDEFEDEIKVIENGVRYKVSLEGQKTGFYADQRDSRYLLRLLANNKTALDLCCYSGGFALNTALGGATHVTGVDSSLPAIELAKINARLNNLNPDSISFLKADVSEFMKLAISEGKQWDLVVLDPPKLAPNRKVLQRAMSMYRNLNTLAMQLTKTGGLLMTCSCSGAMTQSGSFLSVLQASASSAGRRITQLRHAGAAADHTIDPAYPEGTYLTNVLLRVL